MDRCQVESIDAWLSLWFFQGPFHAWQLTLSMARLASTILRSNFPPTCKYMRPRSDPARISEPLACCGYAADFGTIGYTRAQVHKLTGFQKQGPSLQLHLAELDECDLSPMPSLPRHCQMSSVVRKFWFVGIGQYL
jgi:hypothetical protein